MGQLCQNTAYVVDPYKDHPELLDVLLRLLRTEMSASMRRMTMRVSVVKISPLKPKSLLNSIFILAP